MPVNIFHDAVHKRASKQRQEEAEEEMMRRRMHQNVHDKQTCNSRQSDTAQDINECAGVQMEPSTKTPFSEDHADLMIQTNIKAKEGGFNRDYIWISQYTSHQKPEQVPTTHNMLHRAELTDGGCGLTQVQRNEAKFYKSQLPEHLPEGNSLLFDLEQYNNESAFHGQWWNRRQRKQQMVFASDQAQRYSSWAPDHTPRDQWNYYCANPGTQNPPVVYGGSNVYYPLQTTAMGNPPNYVHPSVPMHHSNLFRQEGAMRFGALEQVPSSNIQSVAAQSCLDSALHQIFGNRTSSLDARQSDKRMEYKPYGLDVSHGSNDPTSWSADADTFASNGLPPLRSVKGRDVSRMRQQVQEQEERLTHLRRLLTHLQHRNREQRPSGRPYSSGALPPLRDAGDVLKRRAFSQNTPRKGLYTDDFHVPQHHSMSTHPFVKAQRRALEKDCRADRAKSWGAKEEGVEAVADELVQWVEELDYERYIQYLEGCNRAPKSCSF